MSPDHRPAPSPFGELTHERAGRILAGASVLACAALGALHSPWWLLGLVGVGVNLVQSGFTNRCGVKSLLIRLGLPGERDLGRLDELRRAPPAPARLARQVWPRFVALEGGRRPEAVAAPQ